jgi:amino acid transporter
VVAHYIGTALPFAYLVATLGAVCIGYTISVFTRKFTSAGALYTFNARGLGPSWGFMSGWLLFAGYLVFFPMNLMAFGFTMSSVIQIHAGVNIPWELFAVLGLVVIVSLALWGIRSSMRVDLTLITIEVLVLLALAFIIIGVGGHQGNSAAVFIPSHPLNGVSGIGFALIFAFGTLTGFEACATVAEETRNPKRNVPRSILAAVLATGAFFIVVSYAMAIGFGTSRAGLIANTATPLDFLANAYVNSSFAVVVDICVATSAFAVSLACANGAVRVIYAMAREGALPKRLNLDYIHPKRRTPWVAVIALCTIAAVMSFTLGPAVGPYPNAYSYYGDFGFVAVIFLYALVCISLIRYFAKSHDSEFTFWKHVVVPLIGALICLPVIFTSVWPLPPTGVLITYGFLVAYTLVGVGVMLNLRTRKDVMERIGTAMAVGEDIDVKEDLGSRSLSA